MSVCVVADSSSGVLSLSNESFGCDYFLVAASDLTDSLFSVDDVPLIISAAVTLYGLAFIFRQVRLLMLNR